MNNKTRMILGIVLIVIALFFYNQRGSGSSKLERPTDKVVALVEDLSLIADKKDANKLSGLFYAMASKLNDTRLNSNLQVQHMLDYVGKKTVGGELKVYGESKYPEFAPSAADLITKVIGPQTENEPLTHEEKSELSQLLYGFAWKLYDPSEEDSFEKYKDKALSALSEYNKVDVPDKPDVDGCKCEGKGYIVHGDGHKTDCPCVASGIECKCKGSVGPVISGNSHLCECNTSTTECGCVEEFGQCSCPITTSDPMEEQYEYDDSCADGSCYSGDSGLFRRGLFRWRR